MQPAWPTKDRPWISQRWPNPRAGFSRPVAWEAWLLLSLAGGGAVLALLLTFPWRLGAIPLTGVSAGLLIVGAIKQDLVSRE